MEMRNTLTFLKKKGLREKIVKICEENDIVFLAIFGSFVRGEQRKKSDIDIAIEYEKTENKTLFDLIELEDKLKRFLGRKVDLGILSSLIPYIMEDVKKEMEIIYENKRT